MKRVVIELVQRSCNRPRSPVLCIDGVIIAGTIVDIDRSIHVQGNSASRLPEFMPELQVGAIDIKPCVDAGCMPDLGKDGVQVLVGGKRVGITKGVLFWKVILGRKIMELLLSNLDSRLA